MKLSVLFENKEVNRIVAGILFVVMASVGYMGMPGWAVLVGSVSFLFLWLGKKAQKKKSNSSG